MYGRAPETLYATFSNRKAGVPEREFRSWFEDMHRPDSFELGLFQAASRQRAASSSQAECLTLWESPDPDTESALARIRPVAGALREKGRILPVLDLVFQQFLQRVPGQIQPAGGEVRTITTLQNDWSRPGAGQDFETWWKEAVLAVDAPLGAHHARYAYAAFDLEDPDAGKFLVLLESEGTPEEIAGRWAGVGRTALTPFGAATPVYPKPGATRTSGRAAGRGDPSPTARRALYVVHWAHESDAVSAP